MGKKKSSVTAPPKELTSLVYHFLVELGIKKAAAAVVKEYPDAEKVIEGSLIEIYNEHDSKLKSNEAESEEINGEEDKKSSKKEKKSKKDKKKVSEEETPVNEEPKRKKRKRSEEEENAVEEQPKEVEEKNESSEESDEKPATASTTTPSKKTEKKPTHRFNELTHQKLSSLQMSLKTILSMARYVRTCGGATNSWGYKANKDLIVTRGKGFRTEKNKKKRGSYRGGTIDTGNRFFCRILRHCKMTIKRDRSVPLLAKYTVPEELPLVAQTGKPLKPSCSSSFYLQISKTWDKGNRSVREQILKDFIANNKNKTGPQLEREFTNGASLFLVRLSAWLRLTYLLGHSLSFQLQAIDIFISASSGHRFLAEFLEVGGVLTVLEILGLSQVKENDKADALRLLLHVANAGRKFKEFICESYGVRAVADCLARSKSEITQDYARNLLIQLGQGNPRFLVQVYKSLLGMLTSTVPSPTSQQMAGQALRTLLPNISTIHPTIVEAIINLLRSPHLQIQYEAYEILRDLVRRPPLQDGILNQLILILRTPIDDGQDENNDDRRRRNKINDNKLSGSFGLHGKDGDKAMDYLQSIFIQQSYAARLLGVMAAMSMDLAQRMIQLQAISGLLNVIANVTHPDSQKNASNTFLYLIDSFNSVALSIKENMGQNFFDLVQQKPDTFYKELTREQIRYLRKNNVRVTLNDGGEKVESKDASQGELANANQEQQNIQAFPVSRDAQPQGKQADEVLNSKTTDLLSQTTDTTKAQAVPSKERKFVEEERKEEAVLVQDLYVPFKQGTLQTTFASNKFKKNESLDTKDRFEAEFQHFRSTNSKTSNEGKKVEWNYNPASKEPKEKTEEETSKN
ncbi:hypothetical protein HK098_008261 [Nowakowskiella sp. JEL0407]|nr:hypothetical protein HK098_008261 [Nowakowskiella sp. JEL0407]